MVLNSIFIPFLGLTLISNFIFGNESRGSEPYSLYLLSKADFFLWYLLQIIFFSNAIQIFTRHIDNKVKYKSNKEIESSKKFYKWYFTP